MGASPQNHGERGRPWTALLLPPGAWMVFEYGLGSALRSNCAAVGTWLGPAWGTLSLLVCAGAALVAWPLARTATGCQPPTRAGRGRVAVFTAAIFGLAIAFQTLATLIVPSCAR